MGKKRRKNRNKNNNGFSVVNNSTNNNAKAKETTNNTTTYPVVTTDNTKTYQAVNHYKGKKNETILPEFVEICKMEQMELKEFLRKKLCEAGYQSVAEGDGWLYAKGNVPVLLTAHMDTVHKTPVITFYEDIDASGKHILSSPQGIGGDDRCGVYMILQLIKEHKCSVLFCEDEEVGGIGSDKFTKTEFMKDLSSLNYMIELDRANSVDAVFYKCDNPEFTDFICNNTGYVESWGSFSDISTLAPFAGIAAVNLSCGYYNAHTLTEYVVIEEMLNTIIIVDKLLSTENETQFEYIEANYGYGGYGYYGSKYDKYNYGYGYGYGYDEEYDDYNYWNGYGKTKNNMSKESNISDSSVILHAQFWDEDKGDLIDEYVEGSTKNACWGILFLKNPTLCFNDVYDFEYDYQ